MAREYVLEDYIFSFCVKGDKISMTIMKRHEGEMYLLFKTDNSNIIRVFLNVCQQVVDK